MTHLKPESPQLSPRPASFFFCKQQHEKENKLESFPHCAFLLTAIVAADQATANHLLLPVQTVKKIKPEFWFRSDFRPGDKNTGPAWGREDETLCQYQESMTALNFELNLYCEGTQLANCPLAERSQTREDKLEFTPVLYQCLVILSTTHTEIGSEQLKLPLAGKGVL